MMTGKYWMFFLVVCRPAFLLRLPLSTDQEAFFSNGESTLPTQWLMFLVAYWWYVLYWIVFNLVHWFQNVNSMVIDIIFVNLAMENPVFVL
jgi:hypothetical protein